MSVAIFCMLVCVNLSALVAIKHQRPWNGYALEEFSLHYLHRWKCWSINGVTVSAYQFTYLANVRHYCCTESTTLQFLMKLCSSCRQRVLTRTAAAPYTVVISPWIQIGFLFPVAACCFKRTIISFYIAINCRGIQLRVVEYDGECRVLHRCSYCHKKSVMRSKIWGISFWLPLVFLYLIKTSATLMQPNSLLEAMS